MSRTRDARSEILRSIRDSLAASVRFDASSGDQEVAAVAASVSAYRDAPTHTEPQTRDDLLPQFIERLQAVGAQATVVRGEPEAAAALSRILEESAAERVVASDDALVRRLLAATTGAYFRQEVEAMSQDDLFLCDAGVTAAQWAIAETGTLVLESAHERNRLASLVPRVHVAVLSADRICATLRDALARVHDVDQSGLMVSRAVTFITGPSRTSDIELTLVIGVHGPQILHVIVLDTRTQEDRSA